MSIWRALLCLLLPPLAVLDQGCGASLIVLVLAFRDWLPGGLPP